MKLNRMLKAAVSLTLLAVISSVSVFAFSSTANGAAKAKPTVVIIKAEWCGACQKVEPIMMELMHAYGGKLNFVVLDVTNDETTAQASAKARSLGISSFFESNKKKTSTVAIFQGAKQRFATFENFSRDDYVAAFDSVLK